MYSADMNPGSTRARFSARAALAKIPPSERGHRPTPQPVRPPKAWAGRFRPSRVLTTRTMGALGDDLVALSAPATVPIVSSSPTQNYTVTAEPMGWFDSLLSNIIQPAASTYAKIQSTSLLQQAQQRSLAQTWNPALTGPAIQAQGWQAAYQGGTGAPSLGLSGTTLAMLAGGGLLLWAVLRK